MNMFLDQEIIQKISIKKNKNYGIHKETMKEFIDVFHKMLCVHNNEEISLFVGNIKG